MATLRLLNGYYGMEVDAFGHNFNSSQNIESVGGEMMLMHPTTTTTKKPSSQNIIHSRMAGFQNFIYVVVSQPSSDEIG